MNDFVCQCEDCCPELYQTPWKHLVTYSGPMVGGFRINAALDSEVQHFYYSSAEDEEAILRAMRYFGYLA